MKTSAHTIAEATRRFGPIVILNADRSAQISWPWLRNDLDEIIEASGMDFDLFCSKDGEYTLHIPAEVNIVILTQDMVDATADTIDESVDHLLAGIEEGGMCEYLEAIVESMTEQYQLSDSQRDELYNNLSWKLVLN